jgi:hypothetical protein
VQGKRSGFCRQCHGKDDKPYYHYSPVKALYVREPKKGFVRIGWLFEECGHIEIDKEGVQSGVSNAVSKALKVTKVVEKRRRSEAEIIYVENGVEYQWPLEKSRKNQWPFKILD